jgi:hypothetical protein
MLFSEDEGKRTRFGGIRIIVMDTSDPRYRKVCELQARLLRKTDTPFFFGWRLTRKHTPGELAAAELLHLTRLHAFEPAGEECGTTYDESPACRHCGAGATQTGPLFLDEKRIPRRDFAETIAGELVVSRRTSEVFRRHHVTGVEFHPVRAKTDPNRPSLVWNQLVVRSAEADIVPPTRTGVNLCDDDRKGNYRCPRGHVIGLNLLSAVSIRAASRGTTDILATRQFTGTRRGLLRPRRAILLAPRVWRLIQSARLTGFSVEVAHQVPWDPRASW